MQRIHMVVALADRAVVETALSTLTGEAWQMQTATPATMGFPANDPYPGAAWASDTRAGEQVGPITAAVLAASPLAVVEQGEDTSLDDAYATWLTRQTTPPTSQDPA